MSAAVESLVWQLHHAGIVPPVREHPFAKSIGRRWRFDLAWPDHLVAVEVDGGVFVGGRHVTGSGATKDAEKFSEAAAMGWRVLRVTPAHVESGQALGWIERALGR